MNAAQGTDKKATKALSEYGDLTAVRVAVNNGELSADDLLAQLDAIEGETPSAAEDDVFAQQDKPGDAKPADDTEPEIEVRIKPSMLKAGNSVYKTVEAMAKGVAEKDRHIDHLRHDIIDPLREELSAREIEIANLKQELAKRTQAAAQPPENAAEQGQAGGTGEEIPDLDKLPELPVLKGDDIYDDEKQTAYQEAIAKRDTALVQALKAMRQRLSGQQQQPPAAVHTETPRQAEQPAADTGARARESAVEAEWEEIDRFRKANPDLFEHDSDLREVESRYFSTVESIAVKAGIRGGLRDEKGQWRPEVRRAYDDYVNPTTESAKRLRQECEAAGIHLPQEMDDLKRLYRLWNTRVSIRQADGKPISYDDALALARAKEPETFTRRDVRAEAVRDIEAEQRVRDKRGQYARETPAQHDSGAEIGEMPVERFMALMNKKNPTEAERETLRRAYRYKGIPEDEWPDSLKTKGN